MCPYVQGSRSLPGRGYVEGSHFILSPQPVSFPQTFSKMVLSKGILLGWVPLTGPELKPQPWRPGVIAFLTVWKDWNGFGGF